MAHLHFMPQCFREIKTWQEISYLFDEVFALRVETDENGNLYRVLQTGRDRNYDAKDRSDALDLFEEPNLKKIKNKIKAHIEERENMRKNAKKKKTEVETVEEIAEKKNRSATGRTGANWRLALFRKP